MQKLGLGASRVPKCLNIEHYLPALANPSPQRPTRRHGEDTVPMISPDPSVPTNKSPPPRP